MKDSSRVSENRKQIKRRRAYGGCLGIESEKKDAANGETLRGVVSTQRSGGLRMGKPVTCNGVTHINEFIVYDEGT